MSEKCVNVLNHAKLYAALYLKSRGHYSEATPLCWHTWLPQTLLISFYFSGTQWDNLLVWYSEDSSPVIKNQLPLRPLSLVSGEEVSGGFPGGLRVGRGNSWPAWQIANSSVSVSLPWHFNGTTGSAFQWAELGMQAGCSGSRRKSEMSNSETGDK